MSKLRIIFMGTPDFAVETLRQMVENNHQVVGVVTMPDKPAGRGHKIRYSPVKAYALEKNIPVLQPQKLQDENFLSDLKALKADIQVVVAFRMLPEVVWNMPPLGTFNLHASLLPQYRGAAPINWAIVNGETKTGVTTFFLTHSIDTGAIILQEEVEIRPNDNAGTLHNKLMSVGATLVLTTLNRLSDGNMTTTPQNECTTEKELKDAPKLFKSTSQIDFDNTAENIHNKVRGLSPYPTAWAKLSFDNSNKQTMTYKIFETAIEVARHDTPIGTLVIDKNGAKVACQNGFVKILSLQAPNKKRMSIDAYLRGIRY